MQYFVTWIYCRYENGLLVGDICAFVMCVLKQYLNMAAFILHRDIYFLPNAFFWSFIVSYGIFFTSNGWMNYLLMRIIINQASYILCIILCIIYYLIVRNIWYKFSLGVYWKLRLFILMYWRTFLAKFAVVQFLISSFVSSSIMLGLIRGFK